MSGWRGKSWKKSDDGFDARPEPGPPPSQPGALKSPRTLCEAVGAAAPEGLPKLARRIENRFKPDDSIWWLVPSSEQPTYRFGKCRFAWSDSNKKAVSVSLHVEKGLSPAIASVYSSKKAARLIMDDTWIWPAFSKELRPGGSVLSAMASSADPYFALLEGGYVAEPNSFDPRKADLLGWDGFKFESVPGRRTLTLAKASRKGFVIKIGGVESIDALSDAAAKLAADDWLWIEFNLGIDFPVSDSESVDNWLAESSQKFWNALPGRLKSWIR